MYYVIQAKGDDRKATGDGRQASGKTKTQISGTDSLCPL